MENIYKPSQIMRKQPFKRVLPASEVGVPSERQFSWNDNLQYTYCTQADFIREFCVSGHRINDHVFYPDKIKKVENIEKNGTVTHRTIIQRMIRVAIPYQAMITTKHLSALCGNNVAFSLSDSIVTEEMERKKDKFVQGWQEYDMEVALYRAIKGDKITGDTAFCGYKNGGQFGWTVFSYMDGDILYPHYDRYGVMDAFGREYYMYDSENNIKERMLDVWDSRFVYTYRNSVLNTKKRSSKKVDAMDSGWELVSGPVLHGFEFIPIAYHRSGAPCWEAVQPLIEQLEFAYSQLAENNKVYALRVLFTKGAAVSMQSTMDGSPIRIDTAEIDADAKYLEPADASGSFKMQIDALEDSIYRGSFTVKTPEVRGSDLSGLAVELLFSDSTQKAMCEAQEYKPFLNDMIRIFKAGYGAQTKDISNMQGLNIYGEILPYLPKSEQEEVANIVQLKSVGALSQQTAAEIGSRLGYGKNAEYNRILKEEREKLIQDEIVAQNADVKLNLDQKV